MNSPVIHNEVDGDEIYTLTLTVLPTQYEITTNDQNNRTIRGDSTVELSLRKETLLKLTIPTKNSLQKKKKNGTPLQTFLI